MNFEHLPAHVKEMRNFITITSAADNQNSMLQEQKIEIPQKLKHVLNVVENLEEIGVERLSLLFSDKACAEIILNNCSIFRKKIIENDFSTAEKIGEAFSKILENIDNNKFDLIGLSEGQKQLLAGSFTVLFEDFNVVIKNDEIILDELFSDILNLIQKWELYKEQGDYQTDFSEGIETGLIRASMELKDLYEKYKIKICARSNI